MEKLESIIIEGKEIKPPEKITVVLYRQLVHSDREIARLRDDEKQNEVVDLVDIALEDLSFAYGVEADILARELPLADVITLRRKLANAVSKEVFAGLSQIPNGEAATEE